jgi:asparagine synthase (glutamine-hydrolysing)
MPAVRNGRAAARTYWTLRFRRRSIEASRLRLRFEAPTAGVGACADHERCGAFPGGHRQLHRLGIVSAHGLGAANYSIGFDAAGYDEMEYARIAARHFRRGPSRIL